MKLFVISDEKVRYISYRLNRSVRDLKVEESKWDRLECDLNGVHISAYTYTIQHYTYILKRRAQSIAKHQVSNADNSIFNVMHNIRKDT